jgi:hypothetical protein
LAREEELVETRKILSGDGSYRTVVLHGLGGVGKREAHKENLHKVIGAVKEWLTLSDDMRWLTIHDSYDSPKLAGNTLHGSGDSRYLLESYQSSVIIIPRPS